MRNIWMVLQQTLSASIVALFILLLQRIFYRQLSPKWQYTIWGVLLVRLLVPAGWGVGTSLDPSDWIEALRFIAERRINSAWASPWEAQLPVIGIPILPLGGAPRSVTDWLFALYLAGAVACALWLLGGALALRRRLRHAVPVLGERLMAVQTLADSYGLKPPTRVVESMSAESPFLMGVFRPVLVVPMGWAVDEKVVLHELLHLRNRDVLSGWVTALFRYVHWCNPFLWWIFDRIDDQREIRCDQMVLERLQGEELRDYGRVLLSMTEKRYPRAPGATTMANGAERIRERIAAIARFQSYPRGMGLITTCMAVLLLPTFVFGFFTDAPTEDHWESAAQVLAYAQRYRCTTVGGALDAYAKGVMLRTDDPYHALLCRAMVTDQGNMGTVLSDWEGDWARWEEPSARITEGQESYCNGPLLRGFISDGEGGYYTQIYFFRANISGTNNSPEYLRHTVQIVPAEGKNWNVNKVSEGTGVVRSLFMPDEELFSMPGLGELNLGEPPLRYWKGIVGGVGVELWPECHQLTEELLNGNRAVDLSAWGSSIPMFDWDNMWQSGTKQRSTSHLPRRDAQFDWCVGHMLAFFDNQSGAAAEVSIDVRQHWADEEITSAAQSEPDVSRKNRDGGKHSSAGADANFGDFTVEEGRSRRRSGGGGSSDTALENALLPDSLSGSVTINGKSVSLSDIPMEVNLD